MKKNIFARKNRKKTFHKRRSWKFQKYLVEVLDELDLGMSNQTEIKRDFALKSISNLKFLNLNSEYIEEMAFFCLLFKIFKIYIYLR